MSQPSNRDEPVSSTKSFGISKHVVLEAYRRLNANRGAAGIDDESIEMFEADLKSNLYRIWNRMSSGTYFPPAVKQVKIAKKNGGTRIGTSTVYDGIAQMVVKLTIEPQLDGLFPSGLVRVSTRKIRETSHRHYATALLAFRLGR